jgi:hypothetical protein
LEGGWGFDKGGGELGQDKAAEQLDRKVRQPDINARYREIEKSVNVSVLDVAKARCSGCRGKSGGDEGLVYYVHCFREENRPIRALCKKCVVEMAGGVEKVYVREAIGPFLRKFWEKDRREKKRNVTLSGVQIEAMQRGRKNAAREESAL